ncbi:hypothetical protein G3I40_42170, partial [Streptomyces sp. SID14478]|nr:hypothetical protein [Streptomyces sp. SID14478]
PRDSADHVQRWALAQSDADAAGLEASSPQLSTRNLVTVTDGAVVWTTSVRFDRPAGKVLWALAAPVHHRALPYLLTRAARTLPRSR